MPALASGSLRKGAGHSAITNPSGIAFKFNFAWLLSTVNIKYIKHGKAKVNMLFMTLSYITELSRFFFLFTPNRKKRKGW